MIPALVFIAIAISLIPHNIQYGPQAAMIAESFPGRLRYSGASIGYQLASVFAGGPAPLIAVALFAALPDWNRRRVLHPRVCHHFHHRGGADARTGGRRHFRGVWRARGVVFSPAQASPATASNVSN